jgi:CBS domain-containing protein
VSKESVSPHRISTDLVREAPSLHRDDAVADAVGRIVESGLPALPVLDDRAELCGIFGEREFMAALFPGYVGELGYAGFVPRSLDEALEKRAACGGEPIAKYMNTEHIDVTEDYSDVEVAEIFLHHRVLIVPVTRDRRMVGVITRADFFHRLAQRFLDARSTESGESPGA